MLEGGDNYGINIDRLMYDSEKDEFIAIEFQKCEEKQGEKGVTPHTSHPMRYWKRCWRKYESIWRVVKKLGATFFVINYAEKNTKYQQEVRVLKVINVTETGMKAESFTMTRQQFKARFQALNRRCGKRDGDT
jgi:hypothetical protein